MRLPVSHLRCFFCSVATLLLIGCAAETPVNHFGGTEQPLWQTYQELDNELKGDQSFANHEKFLSAPLLRVINAAPQADRAELVRQVAIPLWFRSVNNHFEGEEDNRSCLVTNGISVEGDPISAAIEYQSESRRLKIRAVEIQFLESFSDWPDRVWCPVRPEAFL